MKKHYKFILVALLKPPGNQVHQVTSSLSKKPDCLGNLEIPEILGSLKFKIKKFG